VHPLLRDALAEAAGDNAYGPVAGSVELTEAAARWWTRRHLPTDPGQVVAGPGSKALLYGLISAVGGDVAVCQPSWVSYAAQAALSGVTAHLVPGTAGVPDPALLARSARTARAAGRPIRAIVITLPDNPTGRLASPATVRALCSVAEQHNMIIISDEIYRDLVYSIETPFVSPVEFSAERTVVTTGLSKNLALGGWRLGVARLPSAGTFGTEIRARLMALASEIWSAPAAPVQHAAALAFGEPPALRERIARSRRLHERVARAVADVFAAAGAQVPEPEAAFYLYPDFTPVADVLLERYGVTSDTGLAELLAREHGVCVLPGSAFGERGHKLRLRVATSLLYGDTQVQRMAALDAEDPCALPWIAESLSRLGEALAKVTGLDPSMPLTSPVTLLVGTGELDG
jgi:aspartate aminotransferase